MKPLFTFRMALQTLFLCGAFVLAAAVTAAFAADTDRYLVRYEPGSKADVLAALGNNAVLHHEFDDFGLLAVTMPTNQADLLASLPSVLNVGEDPDWHLSAQTIPYGIDLVNARDQWDADRDGVVDSGAATGAGLRICIIDTGIYAAHEDLGAGGVAIINGRSWVDEVWFEDQNGHGTHVAGTIAAANNDVGVVGVSPGTVELLIADVFNDAGEGQASSTILDAALWCGDQGADIISMSLSGLQPDEGIEAGYQSLYDRGILLVAAAGNDTAPAIKYPASYDAVVSVAAVDSDEAVADFSSKAPQVEVAAPGVAVLSTYPVDNSLDVENGPSYAANSIANTGEPGVYPGVLLDGGFCDGPVVPGAYDGALVLCQRGGAGSFGTKIDHAAAGGAVGAIIYNNAEGNFNGTWNPALCCGEIPAISLSQADGQDALNHVGEAASMLVEAPSTDTYAEVSGTSMATPHTSATAAVHWSACRDLSNDQVRSHLSATTRDSSQDLIAGRDIFYGYGIVQVKQGVDALTDGIDDYDASQGNGNGGNPANVECPEDVAGALKAHGAGWIRSGADDDEDSDSDGINFMFNAEQTDRGASGKLKLKDDDDVRIDMPTLSSFDTLTEGCGPVAAGDNAIVIEGNGTYNSRPASFRACAADNGTPGKGNDLFYLECTSGCGYSTSLAGSDGVLGGGNVRVTSGEEAGAGAGGGNAGSGEPDTVMLDPVLLTRGVAGALQVFTATVYDAGQQPVAGATVTLEAVTADGTVERASATTGPAGTALIVRTLGDGDEYRATAGAAESNIVKPSR